MVDKEKRRAASRDYMRRRRQDPEFRAKDSARTAAYNKKRRNNNPEYRAYLKEYYRRNREKWWRLRGIQLTGDAYDALLQSQNSRCAICTKPQGQQTFHVDHDHSTGRVRGLLCAACNKGIGHFGDNPSTLRAAIAYLER